MRLNYQTCIFCIHFMPYLYHSSVQWNLSDITVGRLQYLVDIYLLVIIPNKGPDTLCT